ncbi:MAG: hypothetical protein DYG94_01715 [Leptolyngbya sp. PLA3]|nr:MAG: hypothetical protein EDM82_00170 [Cyanobacteria bacterium CYA]MCE7967449.1 hypothetical protein [Leptolyngbya sp. PL-A3]
MEDHATPTPARRFIPVLLVVLLFYAASLPVVFSSHIVNGRAAADHLNYHEPVIHNFAREWPTPDLSNYHSATTPLYHLLFAGIEVFFEPSRRGFMLLAGVFTAALLALLVGAMRGTTVQRLSLALPVLGSMYVLFPGIWLLPDNVAWLGVLGILLLALRAGTMRALLLVGGPVLLLLVLTRQIHLWAAGVLWAAAWLGTDRACEPDVGAPLRPLARMSDLVTGLGPRLKRLAPAVLATLPAFAAIGYFVNLWGGFIVPRYQTGYHGGYEGWNPATAAFFLSIVGSFAPFYLAHARTGLRRLWRSPRVLIGVVALALVLTLIPETTYAAEEGRKSGLWNLVKAAPVIAGHTSIVLAGLAPIGAVLVAGLLAQMRPREAWIYLGAMVGFVVAQTASPQLWQRYHEPFILILLALMSTEVAADGPSRPGRWTGVWQVAGPALLGLGLAGVSFWTIATDKPAVGLPTGDFERSKEYEPLR